MNRTLLSALLVGAAATTACSDQPDPLSPTHTGPAPSVAVVHASAAVTVAAVAELEDALGRLVPALGSTASARQVDALLRQIIVQRGANDAAGAERSTRAIEALLDQIERAQPGLAAEIDAIRLALAGASTDRMHKPFIVAASRAASRTPDVDRAPAADTGTLTRKPADDERMHKPFIADRMHKPF
jgi:hypothetical protein